MEDIFKKVEEIKEVIEVEDRGEVTEWVPKSPSDLDWYIELHRAEITDLERNINDIEEKLLYYKTKKDKIIKKLDFIDSKIQAKTEMFISNQDLEKLQSTKTQYTMNLPNGKITIKKAKENMKANENLINLLGENSEFIELKKSLKWAEFKKQLKIIDGKVYNTDTGEQVDGVDIEKVQAIVSIEY